VNTEKSKQSVFAEKIRTRIWQDEPDPENPWHARSARIHGYSMHDLIDHCDYVSMIFLMFRGELPDERQRELMRRILIAFCDPGPRHDAVRAAMNAAASGTQAASLLPIGLSVLGGDWLGSVDVENSARFIGRALKQSTSDIAEELLASRSQSEKDAEDIRLAPGFGSRFGSVDPYPAYILRSIAGNDMLSGALRWVLDLHEALTPSGVGCLMSAVFAAASLELGFPSRNAGILFQLASAPGIAAHALEMRGKGPQAMPFVDDADYVILPGEAAP